MRIRRYYVYIITNKHNTVLYIGMTNDIMRRMGEHMTGAVKGFSKQYNLNKLIYLEEFSNVQEAIAREKQLKNWRRAWKLNLIRLDNPDLNDLSADWPAAEALQKQQEPAPFQLSHQSTWSPSMIKQPRTPNPEPRTLNPEP